MNSLQGIWELGFVVVDLTLCWQLQTDITELFLTTLLSLGKISKNKVSKLKTRFNRLHETLKSVKDSEVKLLGQAKRSHAELVRLQEEMERTEEQSTSEEPESEVTKLRQQILHAYNELKAAEDRDHQTQYEMECLWEEKRYLEKENEIQLKPAELEGRTKALQDKYEDLRKEVAQRQLEVRSLMEDVATHEMQILKEQKELEDKKAIIELKEAERAQLISVPDQILKETERKHTKREAAIKKIEALNTEISEMEQQVKKVNEHNHSLLTEKKKVMKELEGVRSQAEASQRESRQLLKEQELIREEEMEIIGTRGILEMKLQNIRCDRKHLYESQCVKLREKNRQMQAIKRMEHALAMAMEQLKHTQCIYDELQAQLDAVPKREASIQRRIECQKEVDALKISFEKQQSETEEESQKMLQYGAIQHLLRESNSLREELHNLRCLTHIKADEKGQKHRELLRAEHMNQHIQEELREKELIIMDLTKFNAMLQRRTLQYCKLCDMIMEEKQKYVKLKQVASQTITELSEQFKVLENETEIQRTIVINKERLLTKAGKKISQSCRMREKLRNDISKVSWKLQQINQECDDNKLELMKLTQMIDVQKQVLLEINKKHEMAIQRRNFLGIQLLEHDEVLFTYYEKVNVQEAAINKENMALETLEKEMTDLQITINEDRRQIDLKRKEVPLQKKLEGEITMLHIQLSEARHQTFEGLNRTVGYKELKGKDPPTVELVKKIEQLEVNLAERERQLLEKELLVDQVTCLLKPLKEQSENCRQDRLSLAKKLNEVRTNLTNTNNRIMAVSAELSMMQAATLSLQQEIKEKELQMDSCQRRMEQGLPPDAEMEAEWKRMLRDKKRRQRDKEEKERLAEENEWNLLPNGVYTTAEIRPNAYIPQNDELPLPKPYGAHAPFKPFQPGAHMRHYRKPALKPLET
ncbi:coiled-coil domain-containing protein 146 [Sphaeramia orbicularis]|uniref:coiled-coil domain-containing protein 146 n=1 Tax=Sphaeramia orbicularis TaxID=375764 RepID=UPI00117E96D2|nr:coiled-coil domain-containing protein 146 [Sphaeramia orbicularis]